MCVGAVNELTMVLRVGVEGQCGGWAGEAVVLDELDRSCSSSNEKPLSYRTLKKSYILKVSCAGERTGVGRRRCGRGKEKAVKLRIGLVLKQEFAGFGED